MGTTISTIFCWRHGSGRRSRERMMASANIRVMKQAGTAPKDHHSNAPDGSEAAGCGTSKA